MPGGMYFSPSSGSRGTHGLASTDQFSCQRLNSTAGRLAVQVDAVVGVGDVGVGDTDVDVVSVVASVAAAEVEIRVDAEVDAELVVEAEAGAGADVVSDADASADVVADTDADVESDDAPEADSRPCIVFNVDAPTVPATAASALAPANNNPATIDAHAARSTRWPRYLLRPCLITRAPA